MSERSILGWRIAQSGVWLIGAAILCCLFFYPSIGLLMFWNILIPAAPLLFVLEAGLWRNICPLATTNLLPRHFGLSQRKKLTAGQLGKLNLVAVVLLYLIVPLRHAVFNENGIATGLLILSMVFAGAALGLVYEWKSAWCSGLCPVHPVEKLYGMNTLFSLPNAHCYACQNCVVPCPDSTPNMHPVASKKTIYHQLAGLMITGGLPGFIWGWFHVPDQQSIESFHALIQVFTLPIVGFVATSIVYIIVSMMISSPKKEQKLVSVFAALGVSCYYWYRIPSLIGYGDYGNDGLLIDLSQQIPSGAIITIRILSTAFFFYWLILRKPNHRSWVVRPAFAEK